MNTNFLKTLVVVFTTALPMVSCDKDYNTIGGDVIGAENFNFSNGEDFGVHVFNKKIGPVQTNNLPVNQFGYLENPVFGNTEANFVTQLELATVAPTFTSNVVVDSVILTIPYFSTKKSIASNGYGTYRLDSIYSNNTNYDPIAIKIFRSGYVLNDFDASNPELSAKYYSDQDGNIRANLDGSAIYEQGDFVPKNKEFVKFKVGDDLVMLPKATENVEFRAAPRVRIELDKDYFKSTILEAGDSNLITNAAFKNYFKGLYFQAKPRSTGGGGGTMMMLDFRKGDITIHYKQDKIKDNPSGGKAMKTLKMNFAGNNVNLFNDSNLNPAYTTATNQLINGSSGHEKLYLKGQQGTQTYIELFQNFDELKALWEKKPLVNDASITFTADLNTLPFTYDFHPNRVYLFDADNNKIIEDYSFDSTDNSVYPKLSKYVYGGILTKTKKKDASTNTEYTEYTYKIRLTEYISKLLKSENSAKLKENNVRLGLVLTEDISKTETLFLRNSELVNYSDGSIAAKQVKTFPTAAILNPLGTVLFGNLPTGDVNYDKRVRFKISYTLPK